MKYMHARKSVAAAVKSEAEAEKGIIAGDGKHDLAFLIEVDYTPNLGVPVHVVLEANSGLIIFGNVQGRCEFIQLVCPLKRPACVVVFENPLAAPVQAGDCQRPGKGRAGWLESR